MIRNNATNLLLLSGSDACVLPQLVNPKNRMAFKWTLTKQRNTVRDFVKHSILVTHMTKVVIEWISLFGSMSSTFHAQ